jgi:hypothetical protein
MHGTTGTGAVFYDQFVGNLFEKGQLDATKYFII